MDCSFVRILYGNFDKLLHDRGMDGGLRGSEWRKLDIFGLSR